jgi:hypothetical protein
MPVTREELKAMFGPSVTLKSSTITDGWIKRDMERYSIPLSAAGMVAPMVIRALEPKGEGWSMGPLVDVGTGFPCQSWGFIQGNGDMLTALSAVEVVDGAGKPEYHVSIAKEHANGQKKRCTSNEARWVLEQFGMEGGEEDNHVPGGYVRNFWRPVADSKAGMECPCKEDEPVIREDGGDFLWRPISR